MKNLLWMVLIFLVVGCSSDSSKKASQPLIMTTTGMIADLVQNIAGPDYVVKGLMGPGVDPHLFKASQGDIQNLASADIIFYNGLHLEGKMTEILEKMSASKQVVAVSSEINPARLIPLQGASSAYDPHIWFNVELWRQTIPVIQEALAESFPKDHASFEKNAAKMDSLYADLHQWVIEQVASVPETQRKLITAHDAFGYFGKAYDIEVYGLQGISTVAEYGVNDINRMVDLILDTRIRAVFVETSVPQRSIEAVVAGVRARGGTVNIGGTLYSDALGGPDSGADTYIDMVRHNVQTIVKALK
ncbi:manganese transporter [candidate division KSB1 bacterium]|nr:manganese transporter [candidate division KSB1 bacterium]